MAWHYMKPNHSTALPARVVFLDTETLQERRGESPLQVSHYLRLGCCISGHYKDGKMRARTVLPFDDSRKFWSWLECLTSDQYTTWVVAHKMSFDFGIVGGWDMIDRGRLVLDAPRAKRPITSELDADPRLQRGLCVIDDPPFILGLRDKIGGRMIFVDTLNWFRCSLKELGESIGLEKYEMPPETATAKHWSMYCERDCEIVEKAFLGLIDFVKTNDCGMFRYTAPSQAMSAFRHRSMKHKIVLHDNADVKALERRSYFGGEIRTFYAGRYEGPLFQVDVNGLFPYVMREHEFPVCLIDWNKSGQSTITCPTSAPIYMIADVSLNAKSVPNRLRTKEGVEQCLGEFDTTLAGPELLAADSRGDIVQYRDWAVYDVAPIFRDYVDTFMQLRLQYKHEGNRVYEMLCKLLLNSLYGKFGQQSYAWLERPDLEPLTEWGRWVQHDMVNRKYTVFRSIGPYVFEQQERGEHKQSFPAIASLVTSYAREYMRRLRAICGDGQVLYQAVDSLVVTPIAMDNLERLGLIHDSELGKLKIQHDCDIAEFRGPNNYSLGDKVVRSGVKQNATELEPGKWSQVCFENAASQVHRHPTNSIWSWETIFTERRRKSFGVNSEAGWLQPVRLSKAPCEF